MKTAIKFILVLLIGVAVIYLIPRRQAEEPTVTYNPEVVVETPAWGDLVSSPLKVSGKARGTWYFEANLPVRLEDQTGKILAQKGFSAIGDWMTEDYVEFADILEFATPATEYGRIIIDKDNPSGLSEFDASFAIPVRFR